jgi:hypothetical protein
MVRSGVALIRLVMSPSRFRHRKVFGRRVARLGLVAGCASLAACGGGHGSNQRHESSSALLQACVAAWNSPGNADRRGRVATKYLTAEVTLYRRSDARAAVGCRFLFQSGSPRYVALVGMWHKKTLRWNPRLTARGTIGTSPRQQRDAVLFATADHRGKLKVASKTYATRGQ